jgi:hypothetical protein
MELKTGSSAENILDNIKTIHDQYDKMGAKGSGGTLEQIQKEFKDWLAANTAVIALRYASNKQIDVVLKPDKYTTVENVQKIAYTIARWYAVRSKQAQTTCAIFRESGELYTAATHSQKNENI